MKPHKPICPLCNHYVMSFEHKGVWEKQEAHKKCITRQNNIDRLNHRRKKKKELKERELQIKKMTKYWGAVLISFLFVACAQTIQDHHMELINNFRIQNGLDSIKVLTD